MPFSSPSTASANDSTSSNKPSSVSTSTGQGSQGGSGVSPRFAQSYGLKFHDPNDYQEAKNIQQAFRDADKQGGR